MYSSVPDWFQAHEEALAEYADFVTAKSRFDTAYGSSASNHAANQSMIAELLDILYP